MKQFKILLLCLLVLSISSNLKADILLQEDFTAGTLPTSWLNQSQQGTARWLFQSSPILGSPSSGGYVVFDDAALGPSVTPNEASLTTKTIDCSTRPNVYVSFSHFWFGVEFTHGYVEVSNDGGSTFSTVFDYHTVTRGSISATQDTTINITTWAGNQADVKVRFRYTDGGQIGQYWYVDDIVVHTGVDVAITEVFAPEYLGCNRNYNSAEPVTLRIFNYSTVPVSNVPVSCVVSGNTTASFSETYTGTIPPQSFVDHTFTGTIDMSVEGIYYFDATTSLTTDEYPANDQLLTERWTIITKTNLPYTEDFEAGTGGWEIQNKPLGGFLYGQVPFLSGPAGNGNSVYTKMNGSGIDNAYLISPVFDLSNVTEPHISFDIMHHLVGNFPNVSMDYSFDNGVSWTKLGDRTDNNWYSPNSDYWQDLQDPWKRVSRTLCELSGESCVKLRFNFYMRSSSQDHFAVDNILITEGIGDDLHVFQFFPPLAGTCTGFSSTETVGITLRNNTCRPLTNVAVQIDITGPNNLSFTENIPGPIPGLDFFNHQFATMMDMSLVGTYNMQATILNNITGTGTDYYNDTALVNNTITDTRINGPITTFPYLADFNTNNDGWASDAVNPIQMFVRDTLKNMGGSEGEGHSWVANRKEGYNSPPLNIAVESPVFDLSATTNPNLYLDIKEEFLYSNYTNWAKMEYSINGGTSWSTLGNLTNPNWYNSTTSGGSWNQTDTTWRQVQFPLCNFKNNCIKFRVRAFSSTVGYMTFAFDNFEIKDEPDAGIVEFLDPVDVGCLFSLNQQVTVAVYNWSCNPMTNVPVTFNVTGSTNATLSGTVPGPIPSMDTVHYTFPGSYDMTPLGYYYLSAQVNGFDSNLRNDTLKSTINVTRPKITSFPYIEDFNSNDGFWIDTMETPTVQFVHGPVPYLAGPQSNGNSWYADVSQTSTSPMYLESPVFDFSKVSEPYLYVDLMFEFRTSYQTRNYARIEYSIDGGFNWATLGEDDSTWYNGTVYDRWIEHQLTWKTFYTDLCELSGEPCVQLRFETEYYDGGNKYFALDNIRITDGTGDDLEALQLILPDNENCSGGYTNSEPAAVLIRNNFCRPLTNVPVSVTMTGPNSQVLMDTIPGPIPRFGFIYYELDQTLDMSFPGEYFFDVEVFSNPTGVGTSCFLDTFPSNNIATENRYSAPIVSSPYFSDFELNTGGWSSVHGDENAYYIRDSVNSMGGAQGYGSSWMLEDDNTDPGFIKCYVESPSFDLTNFTNPQISFDLKYLNPNNAYTKFEYTTNGTTWTLLGASTDPTWYDDFQAWRGIDTVWHRAQYSLCGLTNESCIRFRFRSERAIYYSASEFAFDNFELTDATDDVSPISLIEPLDDGCLFSTNQQIKVAVYNWTCSDVFDVDVSSMVSGTASGTFTGNIPGPIPAQDTVHVILNGSFDMTPLGIYYFETTTSLATDNVSFNDVLRDTIDVTLPKVGTFPHEIDFDASDELWLPSSSVTGLNWEWGTIPYLGGPDGNGKSWYTTDSTAIYGEFYLESPVFDLSGLTNPTMTFDLKYDLNGYTYVYMDYSDDGGVTWQKLGSIADPRWYTSFSSWVASNVNAQVDWLQVSQSLCEFTGNDCVKFRLSASYNGNYLGQFGFDNFKIRDMEDVAPLSIVSPVQDNCLYSGADTVKVEVYNWSCQAVTNIPITYEITGPVNSTATETIASIPAETRMIYSFNTTANLVPIGNYDISIFTDVNNEVNRVNDTIDGSFIVDHLLVNTFDYLEDFNAGPGFGNWINYNSSNDTTRTFLWGQVPYLGGDEGRQNSWYTEVTTGSNSAFYLEGPVYDFTNVTNPELFLDVKFDLTNYHLAEHQIQYTTDGGDTWYTLGSGSDPNWYNHSNGWREDVPMFTNYNVGLCHLIGEPCVKFRVCARAPGVSFVFAMDNWHITDTPIDLAADLIYSCSGSQYELELTVINRDLACITAPVITSFEVGYTVDGGAPILHSFSGLNIPEDSSELVIIPNITIPNTNSVVKLWIYEPNGLLNDQVFENDTLVVIADQWPNCNDHCSNATPLTIGTTTTSQTANATIEPGEDPLFTNCGPITIENTVWYSFMTDAQGGMVTIDFENINCDPSANGIQVSIDELTGPPCQSGSLTNIYCNSPVDTVPFGHGPVMLPPNTTYYIVVDGFAGNSCDFDIVLDGAIFDPNPSGNANVGNNVSCFGGSDGQATVLASNGTSPYSYQWDNGETTATAIALNAGTHTVTVTESGGNSFTASVLITEPPLLSVSATSTMSTLPCNGDADGSASATVTGGVSAYTYNWTNGGTTATITGLSAGIHTVTVTDANGCIEIASVTISEPDALAASSSGVTPVTCNGGNDGAASISASGGVPNYTFAWDSGQSGPTVTTLSAGTHTVTLTDANGCTLVESVVITEPAAIITNTTIISQISCNGLNDGSASISATGGTPGYTYSWDNGETTATAIALGAGSHTVTLVDLNGCSIVETVQITEPSSLSVTASSTEVSCNGLSNGTATVTVSGGTPGYTYNWNNGETSPSITGLPAGTYSVTISDMNGCSEVETIQVPEPTGAPLFVFFNTDEVSCLGVSDGVATAAASYGTMPYTYQWDANAGNQTTAIATGLTMGTFMVTVTDANGCFMVDGVLIGEEPCDYCQIADDNNTDICAVLTADPTDPLSTLDCDGDGVTNGDECTDTTDPMDPCDFEEGSVTLPVTADQSGCINLCSDLTVVTTLIPNNIVGASPISIRINVIELNGVDTDPTPIIVRMPSDPRLTFIWNIAANPSWNYTGDNGLFHTFSFVGNSGVFLGGTTQSIVIGLAEGLYDPQGTDGITSISPSVVPFSGGECTITNNTDPESLVYFW